MTHARPTTFAAWLALLLALSGTAVATSGSTMLVGRSNAADRRTSLTNSGTGPALSLRAPDGTPVLSVSGNRTRVPHLNADLVDGLEGWQLQRRVTGVCAPGSAVTSVGSAGTVACAAAGYSLTRMVSARITSHGKVALLCTAPTAHVTGGGFELPAGSGGYAVTSAPLTDYAGREGWRVWVAALPGHRYDGTGYAYAVCTG